MATQDIIDQLRAKIAQTDQQAVAATLRDASSKLLNQYGLQLGQQQCALWTEDGRALTYSEVFRSLAQTLPPLRLDAAVDATLQNLVNQVVK